MAFVVQSIALKQPDGKWWGQVDPASAQRIAEFVKSLNLVKRKVRRRLDDNTILTRLVFESEAAYNQYLGAMSSNPDYQAKSAWAKTQAMAVSNKTRTVTL
jgi:(2Fe-2S) ferredoxin